MPAYTEDDTFRKLTQSPYNDVLSFVMNHFNAHPHHDDWEVEEHIIPMGWTYPEFLKIYKGSAEDGREAIFRG